VDDHVVCLVYTRHNILGRASLKLTIIPTQQTKYIRVDRKSTTRSSEMNAPVLRVTY
jgi:hypothetical protein